MIHYMFAMCAFDLLAIHYNSCVCLVCGFAIVLFMCVCIRYCSIRASLRSLLFCLRSLSLCVCVRYCSLPYRPTSPMASSTPTERQRAATRRYLEKPGYVSLFGGRYKSLTVRITVFVPLKMRRHVFGWQGKDSFDLASIYCSL
jgi:hypothetical protein